MHLFSPFDTATAIPLRGSGLGKHFPKGTFQICTKFVQA